VDTCDRLIADDFVEHAVATFGQSAPGRVRGPATMRLTAQFIISAFPDTMTIESIIAEGDEVAVRVSARGTNRGPIGGVIPPTGREFVAGQTHGFRVADGKLAEHWAVRDDLSAMLQLGVLQPPAPHHEH